MKVDLSSVGMYGKGFVLGFVSESIYYYLGDYGYVAALIPIIMNGSILLRKEQSLDDRVSDTLFFDVGFIAGYGSAYYLREGDIAGAIGAPIVVSAMWGFITTFEENSDNSSDKS
jgi:hypothetical protein